MNIKDRIEQINEVTINLVKFQVEQQKLEDYLANGGDPKDLIEQNGKSGLPVDGDLPF